MVTRMSAGEPSGAGRQVTVDGDIEALIPIVRRIIGARVNDRTAAEDLVQETLLRVLAAADRVDSATLEPYAIATARNLVASMWKTRDRDRRHRHRMVDLASEEAPDERMLRREEQEAVAAALGRLSERERTTLIAHEVSGRDTRSIANDLGSTAGAVAAQLNRTRARLRVEYLLALEEGEPPTDRCRPVLLALSSADRRRQREVDAARHLLECAACAGLAGPLLDRGRAGPDTDQVRIQIRGDPDIVQARKSARSLAADLDFSRTETTLIATAVSEIARNIVRFAGEGQMLLEELADPRPGIRIVARDSGPGIADVEQALRDGYSTYHGLGLGLPGARRLMDEFHLTSERGRGTTVTMTKWRSRG